MRRQYRRLTADEWNARLNTCMKLVLDSPERFPECIRMWAEFRREWLLAQEREEPRDEGSVSD